MKRLLAPVLAAACVAGVAFPVLAQPYGSPRPVGGQGVQLRQRADQLEQRIRRGIVDGSLDRREADRVLGELTAARRLEDDLLARDRGVLTVGDRQQVAVRLDQLERSIRWLRNNDRVAGGRPDDRGGFHYGYGRDFWIGAPQTLDERVDWLEMRVRRGIDNGSLTRRESDRAFDMLRDFRRTRADLTARDGGRLNGRDRDLLSARLDGISQQIRGLQTNDRRD
jgi:hypothetical protein